MSKYVRDRIKKKQDERYYKRYPEKRPKPESISTATPPADVNTELAHTLAALRESIEKQGKRERKDRQRGMVDKMMGPIGKLVPRGMTMPDDMVRNRHLYTGGRPKKVKLF